MDRKESYYEIDLGDLFKDSTLDEMFYARDLKQRKLFLMGEIDEGIMELIVKHILQYNADDKDIPIEERVPVKLYISSPGGSVDAGFELIDAIEASKTPVYTINTGFEYSMGFLIGLAGDIRYATQNAKFLMHDGSSCVYSSGTKAQDVMKFNQRIEDRIKEYVLKHSKISEEEYDRNLRVEWYLFADEAKEKGFADKIVGVDCDIDEIV